MAAVSTSTPTQERTRAGLLVWALTLLALHCVIVGYFLPYAWLSSSIPITGVDFDTHAEQSFRVLEGLLGWGKSWVYDVHLQAGFPNGTIFDADNKLWELWTYLLVRLGVARESAHLFLLAPLLVLANRLLRVMPIIRSYRPSRNALACRHPTTLLYMRCEIKESE